MARHVLFMIILFPEHGASKFLLRVCSVLAILLFLTLYLTSPFLMAEEGRSPFSNAELEPLLESLQGEGLSRSVLDAIFYDPRLRKTDHAITLNIVNPDGAERYRQFYTPLAVGRAKDFKHRHIQTFNRIEQEYGVPANIIVAVLLVETQLGTYPLPYRVLEVYTTLVVNSGPAAIDEHYRQIQAEYPDLTQEYFAQRVTKKARWAYRELVALLKIEEKNPQDLYHLRGSYAGAFGMPQFLPSSYLHWATDGNGDGSIDLDNAEDAIASIANYLREHGWVADVGLERKMRSVWKYNHSPHYVNAVFEISRRMTLPSRKTGSLRAEQAAVPVSR